MINPEILLGLPGYQITGVEWKSGEVRISARYTGPKSCPHCGATRLRDKGRYGRRVRHENWGLRPCVLQVEGRICTTEKDRINADLLAFIQEGKNTAEGAR